MKLRTLAIEHLPGVEPGFALEGLQDGVNVVVGPNASGKSSLVRALSAVLYRDALRDEPGLSVSAVFETGDSTLRALRLGSQLSWRRDGELAEPPPLPEARFLSCFTLGMEDLLTDRIETDRAIAAHLSRELAGGFDIRAVREGDTFPRKRNYRHESAALREARQLWQQRQDQAQRLRARQDRLESLRADRDAAASAGDRAQWVERALTLLDTRRRRLDLETRLGAFPSGMDRLQGNEAMTLKDLRARREQLEDERQRADEAFAAAAEQLEQSRLPEGELDEAAINEHKALLQELQGLEADIDHQRDARRQAGADLHRAISELGGRPPATAPLDLDTVQKIERHLDRKRGLDADIAALRKAREQYPDGSDTADPTMLERAAQALRDWLSAPVGPQWDTGRIALAALVILSGAAAIGLGMLWSYWAALLLAPFAAGLFGLLRETPGKADRAAARQAFLRTQHAPPDWCPAAVRARLDELDSAVRDARLRQEQAAERRRLDNALAEREQALDELTQSLSSLTGSLGRDPLLQDVTLDRWLRLTLAHDDARDRLAGIEQSLADAEARAEHLRNACVAFLGHHDAAPDSTPASARTLSTRMDDLTTRLQRQRAAVQARATASGEIERCRRELEATESAIDALFSGVGLASGDEVTLKSRLAQLADWKDTRDELERVCAVEASQTAPLRDQAALLERVQADDEAGLRRDLAGQQTEAGNYETLVREISAIEAEVRQTERQRELETARARTQAASEALRDRLREALLAEAGDCLLEQVEQEYVQQSQPRALRQAKEWFGRFTRHAWSLEFTPGAENPFTALETASGQRRALSHLSTGTRMQLLIAVRVAFAAEAERGRESLPLFLDETLATTDPERFHAVAESLQTLAADGHQIFYLTAQPVEVQYWQRVDPDIHCIDLAHTRRLGAAASTYPDITAPALASVPPPHEQSPAAYAASLSIPAVDPWQPVEAMHPFYLLPDELPLLHKLLTLGLRHAGAVQALLDAGAPARWLSEQQRALLRRRIAAASAWLASWRQGRGQPVTRAALERSGAVSDRFLNAVDTLNRAFGGDAARLLHALDGGEIKGFRREKREQLAEWLAERGYRDERPRLDESAITIRVMEALQRADAAGTPPAREPRLICETLSRSVAATIDAGQDTASGSSPQ